MDSISRFDFANRLEELCIAEESVIAEVMTDKKPVMTIGVLSQSHFEPEKINSADVSLTPRCCPRYHSEGPCIPFKRIATGWEATTKGSDGGATMRLFLGDNSFVHLGVVPFRRDGWGEVTICDITKLLPPFLDEVKSVIWNSKYRPNYTHRLQVIGLRRDHEIANYFIADDTKIIRSEPGYYFADTEVVQALYRAVGVVSRYL